MKTTSCAQQTRSLLAKICNLFTAEKDTKNAPALQLLNSLSSFSLPEIISLLFLARLQTKDIDATKLKICEAFSKAWKSPCYPGNDLGNSSGLGY